MDHRHALDTGGLGGFFQVQLGQHRHDEDIVIAVSALRDQRFKDPRRVLPGQARHIGAVHSLPLLMGVFMRSVGNLCPLKHPHCVGFCFFCHI